MTERNCMYCRHCLVASETQGYSEWTPGAPMEFRCEKDKWDMSEMMSRHLLVEALEAARVCKLFEPES